MPRVKSIAKRPGRPRKVPIEQETSTDDSSPIEQETRSSKKQKTIQQDSSPSDMDTSNEPYTDTIQQDQSASDMDTDEQQPDNPPKMNKQQAQKPITRKPITRSKNKLRKVPHDSTPIELDTDTEEQQQPEAQNPPTRHKPKKAPKPTTTLTEEQPAAETPPTSPKPKKAPTTTVTKQQPESQTPPTSPTPKKAPKPTTTVTEQQQPEAQPSLKPKKALKPTTIVTQQQPESQTGTEPQVAANTTPISFRMTKAKLKNVAHVPDILSHIDPASTPTDMRLKTKFHGPRTLHWETLAKLHVHTQFSAWITPVWRKFFDLQRPVYKKLIFEFFSTYKFNIHAAKDTSAMSFSLRGKHFNLSFKDFGVAMNLYTREEVEGSDIGSGLWGWPSDVTLGEFWSTFGVGQYQKNMSCTSITKPAYRILHRLISESINQRGSCTNLVTQEDMFYMFCIVNNRPCNIAKCLARYLYKSVGKSENSAVCGGAYITQLAVGLEVITEEELDKMEVLASTGFFDVSQLRKLEIVDKYPPLRFVDPSNDAAKDAKEKDTTDAASRLSAVEGEVRAIRGELHWVSEGLQYLIQKLGHSFEPPPHVKAPVQATDQNTSASPDTSNPAGSSFNPSSS